MTDKQLRLILEAAVVLTAIISIAAINIAAIITGD